MPTIGFGRLSGISGIISHPYTISTFFASPAIKRKIIVQRLLPLVAIKLVSPHLNVS